MGVPGSDTSISLLLMPVGDQVSQVSHLFPPFIFSLMYMLAFTHHKIYYQNERPDGMYKFFIALKITTISGWTADENILVMLYIKRLPPYERTAYILLKKRTYTD